MTNVSRYGHCSTEMDWTWWVRCCTRGRFALVWSRGGPDVALCTYLTCVLALNRVANPPSRAPMPFVSLRCAASTLPLLLV